MERKTVEDVVRQRPVDVIAADSCVSQACHVLARSPSGAAVVVREKRLVGLLAESDMAIRVVELGLDVRIARVEQVMACRPPAVPARARLADVGDMMRRRGLGLVAVTRGGAVVGVVTLADLPRGRPPCARDAGGALAPERAGGRPSGPPRGAPHSGMSPVRPST